MKKNVLFGALSGLALIVTIWSLISLGYLGAIDLDGQTAYDKDMEDSNGLTKSILNPVRFDNVVEANNLFALDFYRQTSANGDNVFFSPFSISAAATMLYEGARGRTAEEIGAVFHLPADNATRRQEYDHLLTSINRDDDGFTLGTANALWAQRDYVFLTEYFEMMRDYYHGEVPNLDFAGQTETSRNTINTWVEDHTAGNIRDLLGEGSISPLTRLVLTNAIHFKADWKLQFDTNRTENEDFHVSATRTVQAPMMKMSEERFPYTANDLLQAVRLPYKGDEVSMLIILPREGRLAEVEGSLSWENLTRLGENMTQVLMDVEMPKFTMRTKYDLIGHLQDMGMTSAFSAGSADLSGMDGTRSLYVQAAVHQAFVEVSEEGTEASAATGIGISFTSVPIVEQFRADRPFIFFIMDDASDNILFMGRVSDPTEA